MKKAIACLLFGGSRKKLPDQTALRGDINVRPFLRGEKPRAGLDKSAKM